MIIIKDYEIKDEIILTTNANTTSNGIPFPETPPPEIRSDGVFPTKKEIIMWLKNKLKRQ